LLWLEPSANEVAYWCSGGGGGGGASIEWTWGTWGPKLAHSVHVHTGVSNRWIGIWTGMVEWTKE